MFEGTGLPTVVAFCDAQQALKASKKWNGSFSGRIIVLDEKRKRDTAPSSKAFKKATATTIAPKKSAVPEDTGRRSCFCE